MSQHPPEDTAAARSYGSGYGKVMPAELRGRLAAAVAKRGLSEVAKATGCARQTLLRALAGPAAGVRHGTIVAIRVALAEIEAAQASATNELPPLPPPPEEP